jgi:hypothetical protein
LFVRAKHWQLFLLFVAIFAIGELPMLGYIMSGQKSPEGSAQSIVPVKLVAAVSAWLFLLWLWSLGNFLTGLLPRVLRHKTGFLSFTVICSAIYVLVSFGLFQNIDRELLVVTIPLHLFAIFCVVCTVYFVAESLVLAENSDRVSFFDSAGTFLLLWFYPVGVWWIQPRVNRLYAKARTSELSADATV